jgi:hypothetical protein
MKKLMFSLMVSLIIKLCLVLLNDTIFFFLFWLSGRVRGLGTHACVCAVHML